MPDQPQSDRLEAVLTLSRDKIEELGTALCKRCTLLSKARRCKDLPRRNLARAAYFEVREMAAELARHAVDGKPYRYVVPLTPEEGRAINEELNGGLGSTHP